MDPLIPAAAAETAASDAWSPLHAAATPPSTSILPAKKNCEPSPRSRRQKRESWQPATVSSNKDGGEEGRSRAIIATSTKRQATKQQVHDICGSVRLETFSPPVRW